MSTYDTVVVIGILRGRGQVVVIKTEPNSYSLMAAVSLCEEGKNGPWCR